MVRTMKNIEIRIAMDSDKYEYTLSGDGDGLTQQERLLLASILRQIAMEVRNRAT